MTKFQYILLLAVMCSGVAPLWADPAYLSAGGYHFVGIYSGQVIGLGDGTYGQLGPSPDDIPATVTGLTGVTQVAAGGFSTIALKSDGTVWFLGESTLQHTTPHGTPNAVNSPVQVPGLSGIDAIAAGRRHYLALDHDGGRLFAWGYNGSGQVGNGSLLDVTAPVQVLTDVASIAAGDGFSLAVMNDNTVYSWGRNTHGQLGLADTADRLIPTLVPGVSNALAVAAGGQHSLILLTDGSVLAAGNNAFGQLGLGTANSTTTATAVPALSGITVIAAGYYHSAALSSANQPYLWGRNFEGQCAGGDTSPVSYQSPQILTLSAPVKSLTCGYHFTIFYLTDGTVWGAGSNSDGQLDGSSLADPIDSQKILAPQEVPVTLDSTLPFVDVGKDMISWSGQEVQLAPTVVNNSDPPTDLTYAWSADPDAGVVFDPNEFVEDPTVTITKETDNPSTVTLTLAVNNVGSGKSDVEDNMEINVYDDACQAARIGKDLAADNPTDVDGNCITNLKDFAVMAAKWLVDHALTVPVPK
jgi:alpha-tubulin suppressor-like RCC1 family protein